MKIINLSEGNSLLNQYVAELRDIHVQNDRMRFRRNIERIGEIMAYEMSKALTYSVKQVQTPLGTATCSDYLSERTFWWRSLSGRSAAAYGHISSYGSCLCRL